MSQQSLTLLPVAVAMWLMVAAGLGKRKLERRPQTCRSCGRRVCSCASRH